MKALIPGSFDPVTLGHVDLIARAAKLFDTVYAVVFVNPNKKPMFDEKTRVEFLKLALKGIDNVVVLSDSGSVADFCERNGVGVLVKGLRNGTDLDYETPMAVLNRQLLPGLETVFLPSDEKYLHVSSTAARELISMGKLLPGILPPAVARKLGKGLKK
ncbi:MAG: pantetheine-phosphate adenylyltransferase [Lachnospiraceae bacterium]|nr:pantetheine-phosphate adenylyltransferase [Lachnospiraceae bacterium]